MRRLGGSCGGLVAVAFVAFLGCSAEDERAEKADGAAGVEAVAAPAARPGAAPNEPPREPSKELSEELRARVGQVPAFARLPGADQAWVLAKVGARVSDANGREVAALVEQLAEVRQFAISEREEPMAAPSGAAGEVP